ncbi:MAG: uroporphyrinogen-III synthase [Acidobacteria bacterium]|nr:uroporphyrinogen-III synthase [Acidobacteriota bacterium]
MSGPLAGRRLLLTRRLEQSAALRQRLEALGALVLEAPAIDVAWPEDTGPLDRALRGLHRYHWILFTSANAVRFVRERLESLGLDRDVGVRGVRVGSVGPSTTEAFRAHFPEGTVSVEPTSEFRAEGLLAALGPDVDGQTFLLPTSDRARDVLRATLEARGAKVDAVVAYRTMAAGDLPHRLSEALRPGIDLVLFASPSAVEGFVAVAGALARGLPAAVIGPVTEQAARAAGLDVRVVATPSTADGLVAGVVACLS